MDQADKPATLRKIRIIGPCGSGKTTIARHISKQLNIPFYQTDNFVWDRSEEAKKYDQHVRDAKLLEVISADSWIVEGVHYKWSTESFKESDVIFVLRTTIILCDWRVFLRYVKTKTGIQQGNYALINGVKVLGFVNTETLDEMNARR